MKAIELKSITFSYEESEEKVLKNADFSVEYGEVALLSGFSGEGKSTVISLISGIIPNVIFGDVEGDVLVDGESILGKRIGEICRKVGVVLQNAEAQIIQQIVEDEIAFGCENFAFSKDEIASSIEKSCQKMRLNPLWKTRTLSGGQKQRLMTAATLATRQKILVLDEPFANLDKLGAELLMNTLRKLAMSGCAVLVVEHRLDMVLPYVDTVWCIKNGRIMRVYDKQDYLLSQAADIPNFCGDSISEDLAFNLSHVGFSVKGREILKDISLEIRKGERLLLLGENGCGKTTLMRLISRLYSPTKGNISQYIHPSLGQKTKGSREWFSHVGVVYQNPGYQLFMPTVRQEVTFGAESEEYAKKILNLFGLEHLEHRHPQSLSEGQKRRVSIAAVAASNPKVMLLDEPTVGQDYTGLRELVQILNCLHEESGSTMITVTHDMRCAEALCDHTVFIKDGVVAQEGGKELARKYFYV